MMKKLSKSQVLLLGLFLAILPYCYLCIFSNPCSDDFNLSAQAQQNNFFELIYDKYLVRNGRYISSAITYLNPISFGSFVGYKVISFLMIVVIFSGNYMLIGQLFYQKSKTYKLTIALILGLLFFHNMPIISEGIYWYTGGVIYSLGIVLFLLYSALFVKIIREKKKGISLVFLTVLLFFSAGFSEVLTLLIVFFLGVMSFIFYNKDLLFQKFVLFQFVWAVLFALILMLSPGNTVRGVSYPESHQILHSFIYTVLQIARFSFLWIASIPLIIVSILYFKINKKMNEENVLFKNSFYISRWLSLFILFSIIFICVFPPYWATGILGQHRTLNVAYYFFLIMWFINLTVWFNYYEKKTNKWMSTKLTKALASVLLIGIVFTGNGYNSLNDIFSGSAKSYNLQQETRFETLRNARSNGTKRIVLERITAKPKCLFVSDITSDPKDWTNHAYNMYFGLANQEVVVENE